MTPRAWALFVLCSVIWGVPYLFIKIAVDAGIAPAFVAWSRVALAVVLLLAIAIHRGVLRGLRSRVAAIIGYSAWGGAVPFVLIAVGDQYITSSLTAILSATVALTAGVLALRVGAGGRLTPT